MEVDCCMDLSGACYGLAKSTSSIVEAAAAPFSQVQPVALGGAGLGALFLWLAPREGGVDMQSFSM